MMKLNNLQRKRLFYGRLVVSIGLYCLFIIGSVMEVLTRTSAPPSLVIGGLLIGAVLILPRTTRRVGRSQDGKPQEHALAQLHRIQKWLTGVRLIYLVGAIFVWVALPAMI